VGHDPNASATRFTPEKKGIVFALSKGLSDFAKRATLPQACLADT
jgi:hypothetical protein